MHRIQDVLYYTAVHVQGDLRWHSVYFVSRLCEPSALIMFCGFVTLKINNKPNLLLLHVHVQNVAAHLAPSWWLGGPGWLAGCLAGWLVLVGQTAASATALRAR